MIRTEDIDPGSEPHEVPWARLRETEDGSTDLDADFSALEARLERERGLAAWLRARTTSARVALAAGLFAGLVLSVGLLVPRADLSMLSPGRVAAVLGSLSALFGASLWFELRPLHRAAPPRWVEVAVLGAATAGALALGLMPLGVPAPEAPGDWAHALPCLYGGLLLGIPIYGLLRALDRGGRALSAFLAAAGAALAANAALALHCDNDALPHLLRGHAPIVLVYVALVAAWRGASRRVLHAPH